MSGYPGLIPDLGRFTPADGKLYRPSNGTEGDCFQERFCEHCKADKEFRDNGFEGVGCQILADTFCYSVDDPAYPREWIWLKGEPVCTAFDDVADPITRDERANQTPLFEGDAAASSMTSDSLSMTEAPPDEQGPVAGAAVPAEKA